MPECELCHSMMEYTVGTMKEEAMVVTCDDSLAWQARAIQGPSPSPKPQRLLHDNIVVCKISGA